MYGDAADKYRENNKSIIEARKATSEFADTQADLAEKIEPITTEFTKLKTKALQWFIDNGLPKVETGLEWIKDNALFIATGISAIGTAFLTFKVVSIIQAVTTAMKGMTVAQIALNIAQKANPMGLIISAITALVVAFVILWKKCDGFRNFWIGLWDGMLKITSKFWNGVKKIFSSVGSFFTEKFTGAYKAVTGVFQKLPSFFSGLWSKIKGTFSSLGEKIGSAIGNAVKSAINGIIWLIEKRINSAIGIINGAIDLINKLPIAHVGKVKKVSLPRLAKGGVVTSATTAMIGEDGAEAVVPLEKNTEWIDKVADAIASKSAGVVVNQTNNYSQAHSRYEIYKSKQATMAAVRLAVGSV